MKFLKWLDKNFECFFLSILLALMTIIMTVQVAARNFGGTTIPWAEPFCCHMMIWMGLLGVSCTMSEGNAIRFDVITSFISEKRKKIFDVIAAVIVSAVFLYLTPFCFQVVGDMADKTIVALPYRMNLVYAVCAFCVVCCDIRSVETVVKGVKWLIDDKKTPHTEERGEN